MKRGAIGQMLKEQKKHVSFHTPGHKRAGEDITELGYSDNLYSPHGVIAESRREAARILGAAQTFYLTDGSTCGVHAMLYALRRRGVKRVACPPFSHRSVLGGCEILGLQTVFTPAHRKDGIFLQPKREETEEALAQADALLLISPDYYGFFPDLEFAREICTRQKKPLVIDGAHGAHLHFTEKYAGRYADMWVDGLHKSLPALTQGAAVSANEEWADALEEGVGLFRTSSPSYPILKSVEEAILYPRNEAVERLAEKTKVRVGAIKNDDWTKIVLPFGREAKNAQTYLELHGVYPEFNDGNYLMFYCSPATKKGELKKLERLLTGLPRGKAEEEACRAGVVSERTERVPLMQALGRTAAADAGIFPPCVPLVRRGERFSEETLRRLSQAENTFGLKDGTVSVFMEEA